MTIKKKYAMNFVLNGLLYYIIGRKLRGHQAGLRLGLVGGLLSGLAVWYIDAQSEPTES